MNQNNSREELIKEFEDLTRGFIGEDGQGNEFTLWDVCYDYSKDQRTVGETIIDWLIAREETLHQELQKVREEAQQEYKQFVLNVLDGVDIADGQCNTKAIRFALQSRVIQSELDQPTDLVDNQTP